MAIVNNQLRNWLMTRGSNSFQFEDPEGSYTFLRKPEKNGLDYIFASLTTNVDPSQGLRFSFVGIFCKKDVMFYDTSAWTYAEKTGIPHKNRYTLTEQLKKDVRQRVEALVGDDWKNLSVSELTDPKLTGQLDSLRKGGALSTARNCYVKGEKPAEKLTYRCEYTPAEWTKEAMAEYILDPNGYVQKLANAYLAENQEKILYKFLYTDILWEAYQSVCSAPTDPVQKFKAIQDGLKRIGACARNIRVTIRKNGIEFAFRTAVEALNRSAGEIFNPWFIVAPDRQNFHHLFGEDSSYTIDEILCVEYGQLVLYARQEKAAQAAS